MDRFRYALKWFRDEGWITLLGLLVAVFLAGVLFGCGSAKVLGGNEHSVVVDPGMTAADGFAAAEQHCAKYGKKPRLAQRSAGRPVRYVFDCL